MRLGRRLRMEAEMDAEMRAHIEARIEHLMSTGMPPEEARRRALAEFGPVGLAKEGCREARGATLLPSLGQDLGFGWRVLRKSPGFAALAIATVALGIGATTTVFSVVNGALLRELPYRNPERLVYVWEPNPRLPDVPLEAWGPSNADFYDWKNQSHSFANMALFSTGGTNVMTGGAAMRVGSSGVTGEFFQTLGVAPEMGRVIGPADDRPGFGRVAVISHGLWQAQFGGDPKVLGKELQLNTKTYRIIGVMPAGFAFPHGTESFEMAGRSTDLWVPLAFSPEDRADRNGGPGTAIGRLKEGVTLERARSEIAGITARFDGLHMKELQGSTAQIVRFEDTIAGGSRRALLIFLAAVFLVLLIAASNVASLVLARAHARAREFSLRTALGASRGRLIRQLSTECLCLAGVGGVLGAAVAAVLVRLLVHYHPANIPRVEETSMDARVLAFVVFATLATVVLCGLFPAWSSSRADVNEVLKNAGNRSVRGTVGGLHRVLTVGQVALTFVLLVGSGLLIRSFLNLRGVEKGFRAASMVTMSVRLDGSYDNPESAGAFSRTLLERTAGLAGVEAVAAAGRVPLGGGQSLALIEVEGFPEDEKTLFEDRDVSSGYFSAAGIPLLEGRTFTEDDRDVRQPAIIVSRSFARRYFPGQSALGKRVKYNGWNVIVGVVGDVRQWSLESAPPMQFYTPLWQVRDGVSLVVRTKAPAERMAAGVRALVRELNPTVSVTEVRTGDDLVSAATAEQRFQTLLLTAFGGIALFLSLVGLYGLMSYAVEERTAEIGIRMALGAQAGSVMGLVLRQGSGMALAGIGLGVGCAWVATRWMASLLFEVKAGDLGIYLAIAGVFGAVAVAACYFPARRATRVDPLEALK